jgi:uncharacterized membrane protein YqaE (UPF0057 family)
MKRILCFVLVFIFAGSPAVVNATYPSSPVPSHPETFDPELVRSAFNALKAMPKKERRSKLKQAWNAIKEYRALRKKGVDADTNTLLLVIIAILLPPLAVYLHERETNTKFWIDLLLFVLGIAGAFLFSWLLIFAAVVYALIVILGGA